MQNFNDIKPIILWSPINITNTILFIIFLIVLYFVYKGLKPSVEKKYSVNKVALAPWKKLEDFKKDLKNLEKKYLKENKDIFYPKLSEILKNIFEYKTTKDISKMTLSEILSTEGFSPLKDLISNIYFKEYAKKIEDSENIRKDLIIEIRKLIK